MLLHNVTSMRIFDGSHHTDEINQVTAPLSNCELQDNGLYIKPIIPIFFSCFQSRSLTLGNIYNNYRQSLKVN